MTVPIPTVYATEPPTQIEPGTGWVRRTNLYANDPMAPENYGPVKVEGNWQRIGTPRPEPGPFDQIGKLAEQAYATMPAQEAEAAVAAAIQFQGLRGYNRDMQAGKSANEAIAKWGPAMFYRSPQTLTQVMKANQPQVITPYQQASLDLARRRLELATQEKDVFPTAFDRDPNKAYITRGGAYIPPVKPDATEVQEETETIESKSPVAAVLGKPRPTFMGIPIPFTKGTEAQPAIPGHGEIKVKRIVPVTKPLSQAAAASAPTAKSSPKTGDVYKGYRFKGGDPSKKENWEKAE